MVEFILTVGISGAGKSYWMIHNKPDYIHLDSDVIRKELFGNQENQKYNDQIFSTMLKRTITALKEEKSVVYCATNLSSRRRTNLLKQLHKKFPNVTYKCVVINTLIDTCIKRNEARQYHIPTEVIWKQAKQFQMPLPGEGWDEIVVVNNDNKINDRKFIEEYKERIYYTVKNFGDQKNPNHTLTLNEHLNMIINLIPSMEDEQAQFDLLNAAFWHDVGKVYTQEIDNDGVAHYYNHQGISAYLAMNCNVNLRTLQLISTHMAPYDYAGRKTWEKRCGKELWNLIEILYQADKAAH